MSKALAVAISPYQNPLVAAVKSAENFVKLAGDLMYGTPKRVEITMALMVGLMALSVALGAAGQNLMLGCAV
jgi:ABC-type branched-subunit amino acid transport system ATPase component